MTCKVHDAIIAKGFRETGTRGGSASRYGRRQSCYKRDEYEIRYTDYGPNEYQSHDPDSNRYVVQVFVRGRKVSGGTAWRSILDRVPSL